MQLHINLENSLSVYVKNKDSKLQIYIYISYFSNAHFKSLETKYPLHIPLESQLVDYKPQKYFEVITENILILSCALST